MSLIPFSYKLYDPFDMVTNIDPICICGVYRAEVEVEFPVGKLFLCRTCLNRIRTTLKSALKNLPKINRSSIYPKDNYYFTSGVQELENEQE